MLLFTAYGFFQGHPLDVRPFGDIREVVFGTHQRGLLFAAVVPVVFFIVRTFDLLTFDLIMSRRRNVVAPQLLREIFSITLYLILFAYAVSGVFHYNVRAFLTTGTVLAAVVGLAMQDTLGNLFSGISLHMEGGIEVGDVLHSGDYIGVVEGVTWRATRIRGFNNQVVILPNSVLSRERLELFHRNNLNGRVLQVGVDQHVPPATVIGILTLAAAHVDGVAREMPCFTRVASFGDSAVVYEIKYFTRDYSMRDRIDADIRKAVWYALRRNEIDFATPIRAYAPYSPPKSGEQLSQSELLSRLENVDLLSPLDETARVAIAGATRVHFYSRGETILRRETAGDSMFILHSGTVSIRVPDGEGNVTEVAQLDDGAVVGEMALLTGDSRTADVVALTDVVALEIGKDSLQPILHDHPELATALTAKVIQRREGLTLLREKVEEEERSLLGRIRNYFGL